MDINTKALFLIDRFLSNCWKVELISGKQLIAIESDWSWTFKVQRWEQR